MKKLMLMTLFVALCTNYCYASDLNEIMYGIRSGIDTLSDVNRLRGQVNQTNAQKQELEYKQTPENTQNYVPTNQNSYTQIYSNGIDTYDNMNSRDEGTSFTAKSKFAEGNIYLRQGKYREAIDSYYDAKELFESINDIENATKAERAIDSAAEMRCTFGDYCQ